MSANPPASPLITPDLRRRLQQRYEEAVRLMGEAQVDHDRVHELLAECLRADPGNILYLNALLANLRQWRPRRKRSWFGGPSRDRSFELARQTLSWQELLRLGPAALRDDPRDVDTFRALADACGQRELDQAQMIYLEEALRINPDDGLTLRRYGMALMHQGRFDEARGIWRRVKELIPLDALAVQALADLYVCQPMDSEKHAELRARIATAPTTIDPYLSLIEGLSASAQFDEADQVFAEAQAACGSDMKLYDAHERLRLARSNHRLLIARRRAKVDNRPQAQQLVERLAVEHYQLQIEIWNVRSERMPQDMELRLKLAQGLKYFGNYSGAIQRLEEARNDPALAAEVLLELGECWQHLRQFEKALDFYRQAIAAADGMAEPRPLVAALYRVGVLAAAMNQAAEARQALERLMAIEPGYRDARERLDKLPAS